MPHLLGDDRLLCLGHLELSQVAPDGRDLRLHATQGDGREAKAAVDIVCVACRQVTSRIGVARC